MILYPRIRRVKDYAKWISDTDAKYEKVIALDVSDLEPVVTFDYKPDQVKPVRLMEGTPVDQIYIGSCTNGRIEDLRIAAAVLKGKTNQRPGQGHRVSGNPEGIPDGPRRRNNKDIHGRWFLRHQPDLRRLPGYEQRRAGARRGVRRHD